MFEGKGTGREMWLRAVCLVASVGLHAGLGVLGWQGLGTTTPEAAPIMVTLAEGPGEQMPHLLKAASAGLTARAAEPVRRAATPPAGLSPSPQPVAAAQPSVVAAEERLQCALPETEVVEAVDSSVATGPAAGSGAEGDGVTGGAAGGPVSGHSIGSAAGEGEGEAPGGRLVLAKPRYASNPKPDYPRLARQNHWEGVVTLRAAISAAGEVESVIVERSSGYQVLDSSAVGGVRRWRFIPARRGDQRVPCEVRIPVAFQLDR